MMCCMLVWWSGGVAVGEGVPEQNKGASAICDHFVNHGAWGDPLQKTRELLYTIKLARADR